VVFQEKDASGYDSKKRVFVLHKLHDCIIDFHISITNFILNYSLASVLDASREGSCYTLKSSGRCVEQFLI